MDNIGTILNYDEDIFSSVGTLYLRDCSKHIIVPCEVSNTREAFLGIFGTTDIKQLAGVNIIYRIDGDGFLSHVGRSV